MFKIRHSKLLKRIGAGVMSGLCAFSMLGTSFGDNLVKPIEASAAGPTTMPTSDEIIGQGLKYLGKNYGTGWGNSASTLDCSAFVGTTLEELGIKFYNGNTIYPNGSGGSRGNNGMPSNTYQWIDLFDKGNVYASRNDGPKEKVEISKATNPTNASTPYWLKDDGTEIEPGTICVTEAHAWIYLGKYNSLDGVKTYVKSLGTGNNSLIDTYAATWFSDTATHNRWRLNSTGWNNGTSNPYIPTSYTGVMIDNMQDGKGSSLTTVYRFEFPHGAEFTIEKNDVTGTAIGVSGAEYTIYTNRACTTKATDASPNPVVIGSNGSAEFSIPQGVTYYIKETKAPKGYKLDENVYEINKPIKSIEIHESGSITVSSSGSTYNLEWNIEGRKVDATTKDPNGQGDTNFAGAEYTLYKEINGKPTAVQTVSVNPNNANNIQFTGITLDSTTDASAKWYVQETKVPDGYDFDRTRHYVTPPTASGNSTHQFTLYESDGTTKVTKDTDGNNLANPITTSGTATGKFNNLSVCVYNKSGNVITSVTDGYTYVIKETSNHGDGWTITPTSRTVKLSLDNKTGSATFSESGTITVSGAVKMEDSEDPPVLDGFSFIKADELGKAYNSDRLNGIKFAVVNRSTNAVTLDTSKMTTAERNNVTGPATKETKIAKNAIVAIVKTHTYTSGGNIYYGYGSIHGLPNGTYEIIELRSDSTFVPGDTYSTTSNKFGTSSKANTYYQYKSDCKTTITLDCTESDIKSHSTAAVAASTHTDYVSLDNPPVSYPFDFTKVDVKTNRGIANVTFTLTEYSSDGNTVLKTYTGIKSDSNGLVDSRNTTLNPMFINSTVTELTGKPLIEGLYYVLEETWEDDEYYTHRIKTSKFKATEGINIADYFETADVPSNNKAVGNYPTPKVATTALNVATNSQIANANATSEIIDTVTLTDVAVGNIYIVTGIAMDVTPDANGRVIPKAIKDKNGNYITGSAAVYVPRNGTDNVATVKVDVNYGIQANKDLFEGKVVNFYEYLGYYQALSDSVYDYRGYVDGKVTTPNAMPSTSNRVVQLTNNRLTVGADGLPVLKNIGLITPSSNVADTDNDGYVGHAVPTDEAQNIYFPEIHSHESDVYTNSHVSGKHFVYNGNTIASDDQITVHDALEIKNLPAGNYKLTIKVLDYTTGQTVLTKDKLDFTWSGKDGEYLTTNLTFKASQLSADGKFYITEQIFDANGNALADHFERINAQTGAVVEIGTSAITGNETKIIYAGPAATITDTVNYKNLILPYDDSNEQHHYTLYAYAVNKETNEVIGKGVLKDFVPKSPTSSVDVDINLPDTSDIEGVTIVVYEYLYWTSDTLDYNFKVGSTFDDSVVKKAESSKYLVASHDDKGDAKQTIYVPHIDTKLVDNTGKKTVQPEANTTVTDTIYYTNMEPNRTYTVFSYLLKVKDENNLSNKDLVVAKSAKTYKTGASEDGSWDISITFDASKYPGNKLVMYQYVYYGDVTDKLLYQPNEGDEFDGTKFISAKGNPVSINGEPMVASHADSDDSAQTINVKAPQLTMKKVDNYDNFVTGAKFRLINLTTNESLVEFESIADVKTFVFTEKFVNNTTIFGDYKLEEFEAPTGKTISDPLFFTIKRENGKIVIVETKSGVELTSETKTDSDGHTYKNYTHDFVDVDLSELPSAGGIGTGILSTIGMILMLGSVYFVEKRRKSINS